MGVMGTTLGTYSQESTSCHIETSVQSDSSINLDLMIYY
jgi:hypothetical protein